MRRSPLFNASDPYTLGDFEEIFGDAESTPSGSWDAVLTCFFIDTVRILRK
jgi:hypothetical protein